MDPATILALISAILPLIQKCRDGDAPTTDDDLLASARGAQGVFAIRRGLRVQGFRGRQFRQANRDAVSELKSMSDDELMEHVIRAPEMEEDEDGKDGVDYDIFG